MNNIVHFKGSDYEVPDKYKFIARDSNGSVYAFVRKPNRIYDINSDHIYTYNDPDHKGYLFLGNTEVMEIKAKKEPQEFHVGDVVKLDNLDSLMTVEGINYSRTELVVRTVWFDYSGKLHRNTFKPEHLIMVTKNPSHDKNQVQECGS